MRIAATGFVEEKAGSVAAANAILLKGLLRNGHKIDFFSKPSFVDPRSAVGDHPNFRFFDCTNKCADDLRRAMRKVPLAGFLAERRDTHTYNKLLIAKITQASKAADNPYDLVLWMGDYAQGKVAGVPSVSFAQGPPGTDARSILKHRKAIRRMAGRVKALKLESLARLRLSRIGLPDFRYSDHIIVGSSQSKRTLMRVYGCDGARISTMPYPVDLQLFRPAEECAGNRQGALRILWLGRIVPRKRLDLFLDGAAAAIRQGSDISVTVVGVGGFVPGYEQLLRAFPFADRLRCIASVSRDQVPQLFAEHDVLCQPSEEENFGSSVAEAQACGLPVVVGNTNGNSDYLCARDVWLSDENPEMLASTFARMASQKDKVKDESDVSRLHAEACFAPEQVVARFENILLAVVTKHASN